MNKILITGAFGYLGSRLSKYFTKCGFNVTGLSRSVPSYYKS
ncbi:LPS biosynthesis protein WbpP, partial [Candidatus Marinimicrobia bacterium]|nr:LPS biosynthesis protein WbpP [Candidatus Neomarinimicrobiota bacterium]